MQDGEDISSSFQPAEVQEEPAQIIKPPPPRFGAAKAFAAYFLIFFAQFVTGVVVMIVAMVVAALHGKNVSDAAAIRELANRILAPTLVLAAGATAITILGIARLWAWHLVRDRTSLGLGVTRASVRAILAWSLAGVAMAATYLATARWLVPPDPSTPLGPLASAATAGGASLIAWVFLALVFAPPFEEFFFRGLLLKGFITSWGKAAGGCTVVILFVAGHLFETWAYWPATLTIAVLGTATVLARQMTGSLFPAIALHGAYNLAIVTAVLASTVIR
jgi:membrane protease YdiL (CAAX protease family)